FIDAAAELFRHRRQHVLRQRGASSLEDRGGRRTNRKNFFMGRNRGALGGVGAALRKNRGVYLVRLIFASARPRAVPIIAFEQGHVMMAAPPIEDHNIAWGRRLNHIAPLLPSQRPKEAIRVLGTEDRLYSRLRDTIGYR